MGHYVPLMVVHCPIGSYVLSVVNIFLPVKERNGRKEGNKVKEKKDHQG